MSAKKKNQFMYSINPDLYERSHKPSATIAMGMKGSHASSQSWKDQVSRESQITKRWQDKYDPQDSLGQTKITALQRTLARDAQRRADYLDPDKNPEIHAILFRTNPHLQGRGGGASSSSSSHDGEGGSATKDSNNNSNNNVARLNKLFAAEDAADLSKIKSIAFMRAAAASQQQQQQQQDSASDSTQKKRNGVNAGMRAPQPRKTADEEAEERHTKKDSELYLDVRADRYPLSHRFPTGPITSLQVVGWKAEDGDKRSRLSACYTASTRQFGAGAFHKVEDDDHAYLFGYDLATK